MFVEDAVLKWRVDSDNSRDCFEARDDLNFIEGEHHGHEAVRIFLDYTGKKAIGAHVYIPEMEWCLLAEISEEEVLGKQRAVFQRVALSIIIVVVIVVGLIGFFVGRFIDKIVVLKKWKRNL